MLLLYYYVPESHLQEVNQALFAIGLGNYENYDSCCWYTKGQGQFRPLDGANPYLGQKNTIETVVEYKVEIVCSDELKPKAIEVLINAHPYETPAYGFVEYLMA